MTRTISVALMAHPKRAAQVDAILARLDRDDIEVVWDERNSRWDTGRRSMLAFDPKCTHHAVIQDDVLVCRDLFAGMVRAIECVPSGSPVCGYVGRVRPYSELVTYAAVRAAATGASWLTMHTLNWGPLIIIPTAEIPEMVRHCDKLKDIPNYDRRLSRFFELERDVKVWYTWPSVVDHADGPSLVPGRIGTDRKMRAHTRVAHTFIGEDRSALDIDWTGGVIDINAAASSADKVVYRNSVTGQELHLRPSSPRCRRLQGLPAWEIVIEGVR
jgi:hypothetical protein